MRFFITKKALVVVILALCAVIYAIFLSGCGHAGARPPVPSGKASVSGPAGVVASVALYGTWIASVGLLCCGIAAIFAANKWEVVKLAIGCFAVLATAGLLHWVSAHWAILVCLVVIVLISSGVAYIWAHRRSLECSLGIDIDQDGEIACDNPSTPLIPKKIG